MVALARAPHVRNAAVHYELCLRELAIRSLSGFVRYRFHREKRRLEWNWHLDYLGEVLTAVYQRELLRTLINMPYRSLKSEFASQCWPAWMILQEDSTRSSMLSASATADLAHNDSLATRDIVGSDWFTELATDMGKTIQLNPELRQARKWKTLGGAKRQAVGANGQVTGKGGDHLLWDDLLKPVDANSDRMRTKTCNWLGETFRSRLDDPMTGTITGIMQRLHELDPTGYLLDQAKIPGAEQWYQVKIEMEAPRRRIYAFRDFYYERPDGELLHPSRLGPSQISALKIAQGINYEGQCNQNPQKMKGNMIQPGWINWFEGSPPKFRRKYQTWDFAVTPEDIERGDYSVCGTWGRTEDDQFYLVDVYRVKVNSVNLVEIIQEQARLHGVKRFWGENRIIEKIIIPFLDVRLRQTGQVLIPNGITSATSKPERAVAFISMCRLGIVHAPKHARWTTDFKLELASFPLGAHDDQVDMCSLFAAAIADIRKSGVEEERGEGKPEERNVLRADKVRAKLVPPEKKRRL